MYIYFIRHIFYTLLGKVATSLHMSMSSQSFSQVGSLLIAHPMSCIFQPDLDRAVIVIDEIHPGHVRGAVQWCGELLSRR